MGEWQKELTIVGNLLWVTVYRQQLLFCKEVIKQELSMKGKGISGREEKKR